MLHGGNGDDIAEGRAGADTLNGGAGIDTADYRDKTAAVAVTLNGGQFVDGDGRRGRRGHDQEHRERLSAARPADTLTGDGLANLFGGGRDCGNDTLTGAAGADTFLFNTALNAATNLDHVTDFATRGHDRPGERRLHRADDDRHACRRAPSSPPPARPRRTMPTTASSTTRRPARSSTTPTASAGVAAVQFAVLDNHAALTNADFVVV